MALLALLRKLLHRLLNLLLADAHLLQGLLHLRHLVKLLLTLPGPLVKPLSLLALALLPVRLLSASLLLLLPLLPLLLLLPLLALLSLLLLAERLGHLSHRLAQA